LLILRLAWKEIVNQPRTSLVMLGTLILGLVSFVGLDLFRGAVETTLQNHSQKMLSADFVIAGRRELTREEQAIVRDSLPAKSSSHLVIEMYSMIKSSQRSRLVQVKAIPADFPYYGELDILHSDDLDGDVCWLHPELLEQLQVKVGDFIKLGNLNLEVAGVVKNDFVNSWRGMTLAPKIYLSTKNIFLSELIQKGSTLTYNHLYKTPPQTDIELLTEVLNKKIQDPALRILSHTQAANEYGQGLAMVADYLGLVTLVALFLTGVGINFIFSAFLWSKVRETAILVSLGLTRLKVVGIYFFYLCFLVLIAWVPTWLLGLLIFPYFQKLVLKILPLNVPMVLDHKSFLTAGLVGLVTILASCVLTLLRLQNVNASRLFDDRDLIPQSGKKLIAGVLLALGLVFWGLSVVMSHSIKVGSIFVASLSASVVVFWIFGYLVLKSFGRLKNMRSFTLSYTLRSISRLLRPNLLSLISLGIGSFLLVLVPQIRISLEKDIIQPDGVVLPDLFMFDIQDDQIEKLKESISKMGYQLDEPSPMVRAKLESVNGKSFEKWTDDQTFSTREEEAEKRFRNRGFNLSFRSHLSADEKIVSGKDFTNSKSGGPAQISLEVRFAERLNLGVGDLLDFDVQGESVSGKIVNLRSVRWSSFRPNFFVVFEPGALDAMPKTYLASLGSLRPEDKASVQNRLTEVFPNISIVDVQSTVTRVRDLVGLMIWAINFMALLCMVQSFVILLAISYQEAWRRQGEWRILKLLGISKAKVIAINVFQSATLSLLATTVGIFLGTLASQLICRFAFNTVGKVSLFTPAVLLVSVMSVSISVTYFISVRFHSRRLEISL